MTYQSLEHNPQILWLLLSTPQIHTDVFNEHNYKRILISPEHLVYQIHKGSWGIIQAKSYHQELIEERWSSSVMTFDD